MRIRRGMMIIHTKRTTSDIIHIMSQRFSTINDQAELSHLVILVVGSPM